MFGTLLSRDVFELEESRLIEDDEFDREEWHTLGVFAGTWGTPRASERNRAARADQELDAVVACVPGVPLRVGQRVKGLRGYDYIITAVQPTVVHQRAFLREDRTNG